MANLPRFGRTWQRFSSLPRPATASQPEQLQPPPPPPLTEPEISPYAPATTQILQTSPIRERSSRLPSPTKKFSSPPSSPKYRPAAAATSPPKPISPTPSYDRYNGERRTSATTSPKTLKPATYASPPLSPAKHKYPTATTAATAAAPLSPLTLPRSEVKHEAGPTIRSRSPPEVEQRSIHYPKVEKATKPDHRASEYSSGKPHHKQQQQQSDVITIKGENVGAIMHITQSSDGTEMVKKKASTATESGNDHEKGNKSKSSLPAKSFMNSNFQGVNNSILYNSSFSHRDPGLHLSFAKKPAHGHAQSLPAPSNY